MPDGYSGPPGTACFFQKLCQPYYPTCRVRPSLVHKKLVTGPVDRSITKSKMSIYVNILMYRSELCRQRPIPQKEITHVPSKDVQQHRRDDVQHAAGQAEPHRAGRRRHGAGEAGVLQSAQQRQGPHRPGDDRGRREGRDVSTRTRRSSSRPAATRALPWPLSPPPRATT